MDYQASESSFKTVSRKQIHKFLKVGMYIVLCTMPLSVCIADDPAPNPLIENITISAVVLQNPGVNPDTPPSSGGSGGNTGPLDLTNLVDVAIFKGLAYPGSTISLLKNGIVVAEIPANPDGTFDIRVRDLTSGTYSFGIRAYDKNGLQSKTLTFTIYVSSSVATIAEGIFLPPTITSDKVEVMKGDTISFSGSSSADSEVRLSFSSKTELLKRTRSDSTGAWFFELDSSLLDVGDYEAKAKSIKTNSLSPYSDALVFRVGDTNRPRPKNSFLSGFRKKCDLNNDNRVNLLDFSIMAFWYKRLTFPPKVDLNTDKKVNLTDLSILAFCWTG